MGIIVTLLVVLTVFLYLLYLEEVIALKATRKEILKSICLPTVVVSILILFFLYGTYATSLAPGNSYIWNLKNILGIVGGLSAFWSFIAMNSLGRLAAKRLKQKYGLSESEMKNLNILNYKRRFREWERKQVAK
ncbi:hypothetical protein Thermo_01291 [Thermoplasmatales archaeon]|nr:hypothetical protein Thermo_01291 [Thermoplasmatales archaeon]